VKSLTKASGLGLAAVLAFGSGCLFAAPRYHGPVSDHFDGDRFHNDVPRPRAGGLFRWLFERQPGPWAEPVDGPYGAKPVERVDRGRMRVTWVNHATVLLQMDGLNILTDPIWSERCSPISFIGPRRHHSPGIRFEDLPPIDVVVISHDHYDHMDLPTLKRLHAAFHPLVLVGLGNAKLLRRAGISGAVELDWWQSIGLPGGVRAVSVPAQHFSNRSLSDPNVTLWTGFAFQGPSGTAFFAGDTGFGGHFAQIAARLGPIRLAMLPIGAFRPEWVMSTVHMSPADAVRAHRALGAGTSVAIHFGTFPLGDDGETEPVERLHAALDSDAVPRDRFWALGFGEGRDVP